MGTGPAWVHVKWALTEQEPPLLQAEVQKEGRAGLCLTCVACEIEAG